MNNPELLRVNAIQDVLGLVAVLLVGLLTFGIARVLVQEWRQLVNLADQSKGGSKSTRGILPILTFGTWYIKVGLAFASISALVVGCLIVHDRIQDNSAMMQDIIDH